MDYKIQFDDELGKDWVVDILDEKGGSTINLQAAGNPVTITYGGDVSNKLQVIFPFIKVVLNTMCSTLTSVYMVFPCSGNLCIVRFLIAPIYPVGIGLSSFLNANPIPTAAV